LGPQVTFREKEFATMHRTEDDEQDAAEFVEFFLRLADQDADLVAAFLRSMGFEPGTSLPQEALLKLSAYCRHRDWETIGIPDTLVEENLPAAHEVLEDVIAQLSGAVSRFKTNELCQRVHMCALRRLTWPQTSGQPNFVLRDTSEPAELLDLVAELIWEFRNQAPSSDQCLKQSDGLSAQTDAVNLS
jgi:hypothetical protein